MATSTMISAGRHSVPKGSKLKNTKPMVNATPSRKKQNADPDADSDGTVPVIPKAATSAGVNELAKKKSAAPAKKSGPAAPFPPFKK